ncbi:MAG: hypothetical protein PVF17_05155, partial [Ignavibacteria bacterium]
SLFSESQSRVIVSVSNENRKKFESKLNESQQSFSCLGKTGGNRLKINNKINLDLAELSEVYFATIPNIMSSEK